MNLYLLVFIGSGVGGLCRYLISLKINSLFNANFPVATLSVNVIGSFFIGLLFSFITSKFNTTPYIAEQYRTFLLTGFLGGYTTFSAFALETLNLLKVGDIYLAFIYIILSIILCITFAWLGLILGK